MYPSHYTTRVPHVKRKAHVGKVLHLSRICISITYRLIHKRRHQHLTCCMILGKSLLFSKPQFPQLQIWCNKDHYIMRLFPEWNMYKCTLFTTRVNVNMRNRPTKLFQCCYFSNMSWILAFNWLKIFGFSQWHYFVQCSRESKFIKHSSPYHSLPHP